MDVVAMLPWWGGVALAVVSYLLLHRIATAPQPVAPLAFQGQFVVPGLCLLAALGSFVQRKQRPALAGQVTRSGNTEAIDGMSWRQFELLVSEAFRMQGYDVTEHGADGGVDLLLRKGRDTFLVHCKQWKALKVGVDVIRRLYGAMAEEGAAGGFILTSGTFTEGAHAFAHGRNIMLVEGPKLFGLIQQAKQSLQPGAAPAAAPGPASSLSAHPGEPVPLCPACAASMVRRTAQKGHRAGSQFWGCARFPQCRGTR